jgi:hypothetical protein
VKKNDTELRAAMGIKKAKHKCGAVRLVLCLWLGFFGGVS